MRKYRTYNLTEALVRTLPSPKTRKEYWDKKITSLGLRISISGYKSWVILYRFDGVNLKRLTLGSYPRIKVKQARLMAQSLISRCLVRNWMNVEEYN